MPTKVISDHTHSMHKKPSLYPSPLPFIGIEKKDVLSSMMGREL
jgi:hypothetical protein